jgi:hypothetical protein
MWGISGVLAVPRRLVGWRGYLAAAAVILAGAAVAQTGPGHQVLRAAGLYETPASFTSLSFAHPAQLPLQLTSTRMSIQASFVITNSGPQARKYQWRVLLIRGATVAQAGRGTTVVRGRASVSVQRLTPVSCAVGRVGLKVQLREPAESIEAWMACSPSEGQSK